MKKSRGFTLIELLVVIAIIALLSSVVLATLTTARMKARDARRISDMQQVKMAVDLYIDANGTYPCPNLDIRWDSDTISAVDNTRVVCLAAALKPYLSPLPVDPSIGHNGVGDDVDYGYQASTSTVSATSSGYYVRAFTEGQPLPIDHGYLSGWTDSCAGALPKCDVFGMSCVYITSSVLGGTGCTAEGIHLGGRI